MNGGRGRCRGRWHAWGATMPLGHHAIGKDRMTHPLELQSDCMTRTDGRGSTVVVHTLELAGARRESPPPRNQRGWARHPAAMRWWCHWQAAGSSSRQRRQCQLLALPVDERAHVYMYTCIHAHAHAHPRVTCSRSRWMSVVISSR